MQTRIAIAVLVSSVSLAACGDTGRDAGAGAADTGLSGGAADTAAAAAGTGGAATLLDSAGRNLGRVTLTEGTGGITLAGELTGLPPGEHAIHLHAVGLCDAPTFESAGEHWNPTNSQHGSKSPEGPHLGDLLNITVGSDSAVTVQATTPGGTLRGQNPLLDADSAAVVVHASPDDYRTQPSGDAGDRIGCGPVTGS